MNPTFGTPLKTRIELYQQAGFAALHAVQDFKAPFRAQVPAPGKALADWRARHFSAELPHIRTYSRSRYDGSTKFVLSLHDGLEVEMVLMPERHRYTLCLSTQVGCAQGCVFCHTGRMGLKRNLSVQEIVGQWVLAERWLKESQDCDFGPAERSIRNIVFMGMGEPLDNVASVSQALAILSDSNGPGLALKRLSVSTAGHLDGLRELHKEWPRLSLALSLHASTTEARSKLLPINRRFPLAELLNYLRAHYQGVGKGLTLLVQYTLIRGVNDQESDAARIVELFDQIPLKVNLIPLNPISVSRLNAPDAKHVEQFRDALHKRGIRVMVRYSKGQDIEAACGQLVNQRTFLSSR